MKKFLTDAVLPFCKGCGHNHIAASTEKALQILNYDPLDVILVTDIGCHGIIDKSFTTHTVHGLHGRSTALAAGISAGLNIFNEQEFAKTYDMSNPPKESAGELLRESRTDMQKDWDCKSIQHRDNPEKKVLVFIGDGGATIGMQHLIDAAHNSFNMTVVVHNNMLYGMTGGQPSEYTPCGFKTPTLPEGAQKAGYDICKLLSAVDGTSYIARVIGIGDFSKQLSEAFSKKGFSLIEVMEICPSYGVKSNPGMKLSKIVESAGLEIKVFTDKEVKSHTTEKRKNTKPLRFTRAVSQSGPLFSEEDVIKILCTTKLEKQVRLLLCGSAGEGVQSATELLLKAGIASGLHGTKKGSYPVTVGVGFSVAEIIFSPDEIFYTGSPEPDVVCVTSQDGLDYAGKTIADMKDGKLFIDSSLEAPRTKTKVITFPFREKVGAKNSSVFSIFYLLNETGIFPMETLIEIFKEEKISVKIDLDKIIFSLFEKENNIQSNLRTTN